MANLLSNTTVGGSAVITTSNIGSYAMPSSGGTLSGTITIGTAGATSQTRALRIVPSGTNPSSFGYYSGSWRSAIEIWDNNSATMLFLTSPDGSNYNYSIIKSVGAGLVIDVGSAGGTNALVISSAGVVNAPQGLQVGGNSVVSTAGGQTIGGITYFSNGESLNVYGIRGRFGNEYMHLYNKVGIGHPSGWGQGEGNTPGYGLSTYGGANFAYGNNADSTFNGIVYSTASFRAPIYYDSQNTNYYGDFAGTSNLNVLYTNYLYIDGTQLTGTQTQLLKNTLDVTTLPYKVDITVNGDANTFYAVQFWGGDQDVWRRIIIKRGYGETAPWDPIGTGVHHGGLLLDWEGNFGGWGGAEYADRIRVFNESYTNVCADMFIYSHSMGYVFMLRGGGAVYHLFSDQPINGFYQSGAPDILYSTSTLSYDDTWSGTNQYDVPAPAPLSLAQVNSSRIDGLRTKKQSLLDNRYLRQGIDISGIGNITTTNSYATNFIASNAFYLNGTSYYLNSANGGIYTNARFETAGNLVVQGTTFLGNANGDEVHINDVLRLGATDSGDAHFFFGEGSSAGSDYGSHWYWDSGYRFTWYTRNAGTDTTLFYYDTNSLSYITWGRSLSMNTNSIDYTGQLHFSGGTRFQTNDTHYLIFRTDDTGYGGIQVRDGNSTTRGYSGYYDSSGFGLLNSSGNWGVRLNPGNVGTELYYAGGIKLATLSEGTRIYGNLHLDDNYGYGIVGVYSSSRYQGVWAMGNSYKLSADGTSTGNLYGLAWSHPDAGGQTKAGLEHQLLVMNYGVTQTAIGVGIWTSGLITTTSYGTSANWKAAYDWGNHASAGYVTSSALSSYVPLSGTTLTEGNYFYFRSNRGAYLGALDSPSLQVYATGGNAAFMSFHRGGNYAVNFGLDADNIMRIGGWSAGANRWQLDMDGNNTVAGSFRAPIFYDSQDTSYYLDPNGNSVLTTATFNVNASSTIILTSAGTNASQIKAGAGDELYIGGNNSWQMRFSGANVLMDNGGYLQNNESLRAPIFYDSADTSYYLDPNSTSRLYYVNAPQGYVSVGNPWGTANSAYFPNGITTAGGDNWVYGHTYVGNAPSNGSGHEFWDTGKEYHRSNEASSSHGASGRWITRQSANGNYIPYSFEADYGNHSYGVIARYHISNNGASDRPSIMFSNGYTNTRWNIGYCYTDDQFRITQNMALAPDGSDGTWGSERLRIDTSGNTYTAIGGTLYANGSAVITAATIGSQSVSYASTAGSAPANGGNSSTVGGYSVSVGASANTIPTRNASGYLIPESWIQLNGIYGLYSPTNGAHLRPNDGSYGSWMMTGSRNGWQGIEFNSGSAGNISLMVAADSNTVGFHNNNYGWQFRWNGGTLYCYKNAYGAGTEATVLDSSNYSSWAQPIASAINTGNIGSQSVSNASTAGGLAVHSSRNNEANKIVRTDANGYIQAGWINTPSGVFSSAITKIYCSDDDYVRYQTPATFISNLGLITTSNIGSQSVSYATTAGTANAVAWGNVSSKPSLLMYYQGFTLDANTMDGNSTGFTYSVNAPYTGPIARFSETGYSLQLNAAYSGSGTGIAFRTRNGDAGSFNPWRVLLNDANYTAYSPSLAGTGASGTWGISVTGSAGSVAWTNVSSRPTALSQFSNDLGNYGGWITSSGNAATATNVAWTGVTGRPTALSQFSNDLGNYGGWLTTGGKAADSELFDGTDSIYFVKGNGTNALGRTTTNNSGGNSAGGLSSGFYDGSGMSNMPTSDWYHLIVNSHHNSATTNQYEFQLATAFWDKSNFYVRSISPGDVGPWRTLIHNGNIGSQSVNYANSAGSATSATTATTATVASQLNKFGDIYGQDWNAYYIQDKFIAAAVYGHSGANRPNLTYDYGVMLSYGETSGPLMQMYFPENSPNLGTIFRKATYRTGWNGNWSTWKTLVEQEGNTCTIVGGNQTGMEIHANVGYNQDPLTYFLLRGQADTSWKALKIRLTGDAGGQDIEFRRIAENGADARMFYVPRGANQVIFEYQFVQGSDSRLKDNIIPITNSLDKVKSLRGVEFDWNSGVNEGTHDVGLIAQDVEVVLPEAVTTQEDGYKNLAYTKVIPLLVEAMKEQQAMIDALKAEIELLKNK